MSRLIDLSQPVFHEAPNCPGLPTIHVETLCDHNGSDWHVELIRCASHTGSHVDAPLHKIPGGNSVTAYPIDHWRAPALILDLRHLTPRSEIRADDLSRSCQESPKSHVVLLATGWGAKRSKSNEWWNDSPFLGVDGAQWLVDQGVVGTGIDHYSIGGAIEQISAATHKTLLSNGVWIIEDLFFPDEAFQKRLMTLWALPIRLEGASGAPCRPVLEIK